MPQRQDLRLKMVYAALVHVAKAGWSEGVLRLAAHDLGESESLSWRLFPGGVDQAIDVWSEDLDKKMVTRLKRYKLEDKRVRDRIALAVRIRIESLATAKDAAAETSKYLARPHHAPLGTRLLFRTVDEIWYQAGDRSTDYNWYTKRGLLAAVYGATLVYWLKDTSDGSQTTWEFLDARIENVLKVGSLPKQAMECCKELPRRVSEIFKSLMP